MPREQNGPLFVDPKAYLFLVPIKIQQPWRRRGSERDFPPRALPPYDVFGVHMKHAVCRFVDCDRELTEVRFAEAVGLIV